MRTLSHFCLALSTLAASNAWAEMNVQLKMEFTKPEIYVGEHVLVNFELYGNEDAVDAEVAKFPEFRGYWSENLVLRQGPIALGLDLGSLARGMGRGRNFGGGALPGLHKATIGTYLLTAMMGKDAPSIEPMKLVVRRLGGGGIDIGIDSKGEPLKLKQLPPVPANLQDAFHGAVGTFNFFLETNALTFQKDEPITLRYLLQGEGNFQEINDLALPFPSEIEVLSKKSFTQGTGQFSTKTFEITVAVHRDKPLVVPPMTFAYFNPVAARYESLQSPPLSLQWQAPLAQVVEPASLDLGQPEAEWSSPRPIERSLFFWSAQALCGGAVLAMVLRRLARRRRRRLRHTAAYRRQEKLQQALAHCERGELEAFLRIADQLAYELVARRCPKTEDPLTRRRALALLRHEQPAEWLTRAAKVFEAYESFSFHPGHQPPDPQLVRDALVQLASGDR